MSAVVKLINGWVVLALALVVGAGVAVLYALDPAARSEAVKSAAQFVMPVLSALVAALAAGIAGLTHKATKAQNETLDTIEGKVNGGLDVRLAAQRDDIVEQVVTRLGGAQLGGAQNPPAAGFTNGEPPTFPDMPGEVVFPVVGQP